MTLVQNITTISAFLATYFRELNILSVFWRKFESFSHTETAMCVKIIISKVIQPQSSCRFLLLNFFLPDRVMERNQNYNEKP